MLKVFQVKRGDQFSFIVTFKNLTAELTTINFGIKEEYTEPLLINKSLNNGITKLSNNSYKVDFSSTETLELNAGMYIFDLRYTIGDTPKTPLSGYVVLNDSVFN